MEKRKVTMKDVAREAGVSTATVSYVLNYSEKEKISHDTRLKVFAAVKKMGYVPNMTAKSLAGKSSHLLGIIIDLNEKNKKSKLFQYYDIMNEIQRNMHKLGYDAVILSTKDMEKDFEVVSKRSLDGVFIIGMGESQLREITRGYYVPVVIVDGYLDDDLFFKVLPDYRAVFRKAKDLLDSDNVYLVIEEYSSHLLDQIISEEIGMENVFINRPDTCLEKFLLDHKNQKGIIMGEILGIQMERFIENENFIVVASGENHSMLLESTQRIVISNKEKAEWAVKIMETLLKLEAIDEVPKSIYIEPRT